MGCITPRIEYCLYLPSGKTNNFVVHTTSLFCNFGFIFFQAADLGINSLAYRKLAQQQIHYALGDTGRSFVCGFGTNPPVRSHHRSRYVMSRNNRAIFI